MKVENLFHIFLIILLTVTSCKTKPTRSEVSDHAQFRLSADSTAVELTHANTELLEYLKQDSLTEKQWQSFFAVYPDPGVEELRDLQKPIQGKYLLQDSLIIFVPQQKFQNGAGYFARYYNRNVLNTPSDILREGKLGATEFIEYSFKMGPAK